MLSGNEIQTIIKGHNSDIDITLQKLKGNNPNLELVRINAFAKLDQIPLICSKVIEQKGNLDNN